MVDYLLPSSGYVPSVLEALVEDRVVVVSDYLALESSEELE